MFSGRLIPAFCCTLNFSPPRRPRDNERRCRIAPHNVVSFASILDRVVKWVLFVSLVIFLSRMIVRGAVAAIDSKALRGTDDYVLSLFVNELCHVAWQEDIGEKENEQSALERILPTILARYPRIRIFTGDAAFGHKKFAAMLIQARRDYFLQLKSPHDTDVALAKDTFRQIGEARSAEASSLEKRGGLKDRKS
jgi:hypothetical protein